MNTPHFPFDPTSPFPSLTQVLPASNQPFPYPSQSHLSQAINKFRIPPLVQQPSQSKNPPSCELSINPIKRIKHTSLHFSESETEISQVSNPLSKFETKKSFPSNQIFFKHDLNVPGPQDTQLNPWNLSSTTRYLYGTDEEWVNTPFNLTHKFAPKLDRFNDLAFPALKDFKQMDQSEIEMSRTLDYELRLRLLEQQKIEQLLQYQILQGLKMKQEYLSNFEHMFQKELIQETQKKTEEDKLGHSLHNKKIYKHDISTVPSFSDSLVKYQRSSKEDQVIRVLGQSSGNLEKDLKIPSLKEQDSFEDLKLHYTEIKLNGESSGEGQESQDKIVKKKTRKEPLREVKRPKNSVYKNDYVYLLEKNVNSIKSEPRRKNKWQRKGQYQDSDPEDTNKSAISGELFLQKEDTAQKPKKTLNQKKAALKILEDDVNNMDFNYLLSIKITNDPASLGYENPSQKFVVISAKTEMFNSEEGVKGLSKGTRVGSRYQAIIPTLNTEIVKARPKKKCPELVWNPQVMVEKDLEKYFSDLCSILKCETINQERALKLLKRKKYKTDKVRVNITKNEKFYVGFLAVTEGSKTGKESKEQLSN